MLGRYLVLSAVLFCIGLYGVLSRRNIVAVLISLEIMFNGVNLALVAVSRYVTPAVVRIGGPSAEGAAALLTGQTLALFVIVVAAAEVALGLAVVNALFSHKQTVDITAVAVLRH